MPKSCSVGGCTRNSNKNPDLKFFEFPKNEKIQKQWLRFVQTTRSDFKPSKWSMICGAHFTDDCQDMQSKLKMQLGIKSKYILKKDAVPTLKATTDDKRTSSSACHDDIPPTKKKRSSKAYEKRERRRILEEAFAEYDEKYNHPAPSITSSATDQCGHSSAGDEVDTNNTEDLRNYIMVPKAIMAAATCAITPSSKEDSRQTGTYDAATSRSNTLIPEAITEATCTSTPSSEDTPKQVMKDQATQTVKRWRLTINKVNKINIWPGQPPRLHTFRSKRTQTNPKMFRKMANLEQEAVQ